MCPYVELRISQAFFALRVPAKHWRHYLEWDSIAAVTMISGRGMAAHEFIRAGVVLLQCPSVLVDT